MKLLGVILSGGKSSRMGEDKGLIKYKDKPMVEYSIDLLKPICDEIVISTNSLDYIDFGFQTIPDLIPNIGPIGGIFSVMNMLKADYYLFVSCDMPNLSISVAEELVELKTKAEIIVPRHSEGKQEPLFAVYSFSVLEQIKKQIEKENYKLMDLLKVCNTDFYDVPNKLLQVNSRMFENINTPKDVN